MFGNLRLGLGLLRKYISSSLPFSNDALQWLSGKIEQNDTGYWEFIDSIGKSSRPQLEGRAYLFDGVDDYVDMGYKPVTGQEYAHWEMDIVRTSGKPIGFSNTGDALGNRLGFVWYGNDVFYVIVGSGFGAFNGTAPIDMDGEFVHIKVIYDNSQTGNAKTRVWLNDVEQTIVSNTGTVGAYGGTPTANYVVGDYQTVFYDNHVGNIKEYDINGKLLHSWHCDEGEGSECLDSVEEMLGEDIITQSFPYTQTGMYFEPTKSETINNGDKILFTYTVSSALTGGQLYMSSSSSFALTSLSGAVGTHTYELTAVSSNDKIFIYKAESSASITYSAMSVKKIHSPANGTITNADLNTFHTTNNNFTSYQNELGYSEEGLYNGATSKSECSSDFIGTKAVTMMGWINPFGWGEGGNYTSANIINNGKIDFWVRKAISSLAISGDGLSTFCTSANNSISLNKLQFIAITRETDGTVNFYIGDKDIAPALSGSADLDSGTPVAGTTNVIIGNNDGQTRTFDGTINDIKIYEGIATTEEIEEVYNGNPISLTRLLDVPNLYNPIDLSGNETITNTDVEVLNIPIALDEEEKSTGLDIYGNQPSFTGLVKRNAKIVGNSVLHNTGVNEYVDFDIDNFDNEGRIEYRYKHGASKQAGLIGLTDSNGSRWDSYHLASDELRVFNGKNTSGQSSVSNTSGLGLVIGEWYDISIQYGGLDVMPVLTVNGTEQALIPSTITNIATADKMYLYRYGSAGGTNSLSDISYVKMYDRNNELLHSYTCSEGAGITLYDKVGTANGIIKYANLTTFWGTDDLARPDNLLDGFTEGLYCKTAGTSYIESEQAYGVWEFDVRKGGGANTSVAIFNASVVGNRATTGQNGYYVLFSTTEAIYLGIINNGIPSGLFNTAASYINNNTDYRIKITRNSTTDEYVTGAVGTFAVYIKGRDGYPLSGDDWELIDTATDNTYTTSAYFVNDLDASDTISNVKLESPINTFDFINGTGVCEKLYIPAQAGDTGKDVFGEDLTNTADKFHNNAESVLQQYKAPALYSNDLDMQFWYGEDVLRGWDFTDGWTVVAGGSVVDIDTFSTVSNGGIRKGVLIANKKYRVHIAGNTTAVRFSIISTTGTPNFSGDLTGTFDATFDMTPLNDYFYLRNQGVGETTITELIVKEIADDTPALVSHDDIDYDVYDGDERHKVFADAVINEKKNIITYLGERTAEQLIKIYKFIKKPL